MTKRALADGIGLVQVQSCIELTLGAIVYGGCSRVWRTRSGEKLALGAVVYGGRGHGWSWR